MEFSIGPDLCPRNHDIKDGTLNDTCPANFARGSRYKSAMFDDMKILQNHIFNQNTHIFIKLDFFMTP